MNWSFRSLGNAVRTPSSKNRTCTCFRRCGIQPNGDVVTCVDYPDYAIGNIHEKSITEIWNGEKSMRWRGHMTAHGNPVGLVKCSRLYPTSIKKKPLIYRGISKFRRVFNTWEENPWRNLAEKVARKAKRGMWSLGDEYLGPRNWRKTSKGT